MLTNARHRKNNNFRAEGFEISFTAKAASSAMLRRRPPSIRSLSGHVCPYPRIGTHNQIRNYSNRKAALRRLHGKSRPKKSPVVKEDGGTQAGDQEVPRRQRWKNLSKTLRDSLIADETASRPGIPEEGAEQDQPKLADTLLPKHFLEELDACNALAEKPRARMRNKIISRASASALSALIKSGKLSAQEMEMAKMFEKVRAQAEKPIVPKVIEATEKKSKATTKLSVSEESKPATDLSSSEKPEEKLGFLEQTLRFFGVRRRTPPQVEKVEEPKKTHDIPKKMDVAEQTGIPANTRTPAVKEIAKGEIAAKKASKTEKKEEEEVPELTKKTEKAAKKTERTDKKEKAAKKTSKTEKKEEEVHEETAATKTSKAAKIGVSKKVTKKTKMARKMEIRRIQSKGAPQTLEETAMTGLRFPALPLKNEAPSLVAKQIETVDPNNLHLVPVENDMPPVPRLAYGLDRVLFNPGVYNMRDPRSLVYNFDPYLESIMPVAEFDFEALKEYITSSRDRVLISATQEQNKKYTGSTSSMTSALAHFHFLLSNWREINTESLSRNYEEELKTFSAFQRAPAGIFARYRDGVYAIDADKEMDDATILMSLGKSMEKLLTLSTEDFERYRRTNSHQITEEERSEPEAYHYTTMGDFLMRSQLDAYDPRLPGTGMFDLKTRAVVAIRMDAKNWTEGMDYEIRHRQGLMESFEREYYDMIRSAFLKYSLQVRMGRMDGIFVAFHNTQRIFGFQYISLSEMDYSLHGTHDTTLGDAEFKLSVDIMNKVLDRASAKFPKQSLRLFFETRPLTANGKTLTYIFAEPVTEEQVDRIQSAKKAEIEAFERRVLGLHEEKMAKKGNGTETEDEDPKVVDESDEVEEAEETEETEEEVEIEELAEKGQEPEDQAARNLQEYYQALARNFQEAAQTGDVESPTPVLALALTIKNKVNGTQVERPEKLTGKDKWEVECCFAEVENTYEALNMYKQCLRRRQLLHENKERGFVSDFVRNLRALSREGKAWREKQDELDATEKIHVYGHDDWKKKDV